MIGLGFIGAGNHARHHMKEFAHLSGVRLIAVFDTEEERAERAARDFPPLRKAATLASLLADALVDAVVIATPAETHRELTVAALAAGKHILLEKPIAQNAEDAEAIVRAAERSPDCIVLIGHCERFNPAFLDVRKAIDDGHIGQPRFALASRISPLHLNDPNWRLGTLDTAVHDIDLMLWFLGDTPVSVSAQGVTVNPTLSIPDQVIYQIRFANGALAQGHIGWTPFGAGYPLRGNAHPRLFLSGTAGILTVDLWQRPVAVAPNAGDYFQPDSVLVGYGDYFTEVTAQNYAFLRAISDGAPLPLRPADALRAVRVAHAAHRSLTSGGAVVSLTEGRS